MSSDDESGEAYTVEAASRLIKAFVGTVGLEDMKSVTLGAVKRHLVAKGWPKQWVEQNKSSLGDSARQALVRRQAALAKAARQESSSDEDEDDDDDDDDEKAEKESSEVPGKDSAAQESGSGEKSGGEESSDAEESSDEGESSDSDEEMDEADDSSDSSSDEAGAEPQAERERKATAAEKERAPPVQAPATAPLPVATITLSVLEATASKPTPPLILHFPHAPPPEASLHNGRGAEDRMKLSVRQCKDKRRANQRAVLGETERMEYVGTNFSHKPGDKNDMTKFVVGLLDRKTMKMKLVAAEKVFAMQQHIKEFKDVEDNVTVAGYYDAQKELVNVFGGKKSKRVLNKAERYRVEETDTLTKQLHTSISKTSSVVQQQQRTADVLAQRVRLDLPPYHLEATERHDIYRLDEIIEEENWETLEELSSGLAAQTAQELAETRKSNEAEYPATVLVHFAQLSSKKGRAKKKFAAQLCYLTLLMWFYKYFRNHNKSSPAAIASATGVPEVITVQFLKLFTEQQTEHDEVKFVMSKLLKLRLTHYILVVHLILSSYSMRLDVVSKDLLMEDKKVSAHASSIGCKVTRTRKRVQGGTPGKSPKKPRVAKEGTLSAAMDVDDGDEDVAPAAGATKSDGDLAVPPGTLMASLSCPLTFPELRVSRSAK